MTGSGSPAPVTTSIDLPPSPDAAALARRYLAKHAEGLDPDLVYDAQLLVTELVANAVKHGQPAITLQLRLEPPGIGVRVHDDGDQLPVVPGDAAPDQPSGRGLRIVSTLASEWGVETSPETLGKTVWFQLRSYE
ncbi:ATP-binding protein [uncultured Jatrophihabitans sp.]|uniref:ATP-binding protein n=1 Tax=uncultured Jatrophihabitans sp. TaxID=1610747 RepID=UPI0035CB1884